MSLMRTMNGDRFAAIVFTFVERVVNLSPIPNQQTSTMDKKEKLLKQMADLQQKIDAIEERQIKKISKLVKKHGLMDFDEATLDTAFALLKEQLGSQTMDVKKNSSIESAY